VERSFSIEQTPVYLRAGAIVPMEPPMRYTGEKPVDPLIVNVWPLAPGASSSYQVYEDSGVSVEYQRGVYAKTPIKATQAGDTLRVEIGPAEGSYPGMLKTRAYELRLPADWPPASVTVNGVAVKHAGPTGKGGWSFEGNTLTTVIPVPSGSVASKMTVEVHRAAGLTARRAELDGFAGAMTRLRGAYDAMQQTGPAAGPPDELVDPMQAGDRLSYHPETAGQEIARFHQALPKAVASINEIGSTFAQKLEDALKRYSPARWLPGGIDLQVQKQRRLDAMARAERLVKEATR
jgi:alpha-glucosidase